MEPVFSQAPTALPQAFFPVLAPWNVYNLLCRV